jgi:hypothetical protein
MLVSARRIVDPTGNTNLILLAIDMASSGGQG